MKIKLRYQKRRNAITFFRTAWQIKPGKILICVFCGLIVLAAAIGINMYLQGGIAEQHAHQLLDHYEASVNITLPGTEQASAALSTVTPVSTAPSQQTIDGYQVLGTLNIQKIGQTLPIISQTDDSSLKVSACYYTGALPGEQGNMVITGHNYADGSIFGKLNQLNTGDTVTFTTPAKTYSYQVYTIKTITPDNASALDQYQGTYALTLMTCTDQGNMRLLVQCKLTPSCK